MNKQFEETMEIHSLSRSPALIFYFLFMFLVGEGHCATITIGNSTSEESCNCQPDYRPLCASDGKTYDSFCELSCTTIINPTVFPMCMEPCPCAAQSAMQSIFSAFFSLLQPNRILGRRNINGSEMAENCFCPRMRLPVCGSNRDTYLNECLLECDRHNKYPDLTKVHDGECSSEDTADTVEY